MIRLKSTLSLFSLLIIALLFSACSKSGSGTKFIPDDAMGVVVINGTQMGKKIAWDAIFNSEISKHIDDSSSSKDIETGIDFLNFFYGYALPDQRMPDGSKAFAVIPLSNESKWENFLKKSFPKATKKEGDITVMVLNDHIVAAWKGKTAIVCGVKDEGIAESSTALLEESAIAAFSIAEDKNINKDAKFTALQKKGYDVSVWLNQDRIAQATGATSNATGLPTNLTKDNFLTAGINFDKGVVKAEMFQYFNGTLQKVIEKFAPQKVDASIIEHLPTENAAGVLSYHFNPDGLKLLADTMGFTALANAELEKQNMTLDGLLHTFTGDIMLAVSNVKMEKKTYEFLDENNQTKTESYDNPTADWIFSMKINDQAAMDKLVQFALENQLLKVKANNLFEIAPAFATVSAKDGYLVISHQEQDAQLFYEKKDGMKGKLPQEVKEQPFSLFLDFKTLEPLLGDGNDDTDKATAAFKSLFEKLIFSGGKFQDGHLAFQLDWTFQNKEKNSLLQLIEASQKAKQAKASSQKSEVASR